MSMQKHTSHPNLLWGSLVVSMSLAGCATTVTTQPSPNDPWQGWNRSVHSFNDDVDKMILKPMAKAYQWVTPKPVDESISNFFSNIDDIGVTINDFMQFKMMQGGMDASRFLVNTTVGVAGVFDVAKMIDLPKHNEDFGQTLGVWGVPSGAYLMLPFFGSSSPRDMVGLIGDALMNPLTYVGFIGGAAVNGATAGSRVLEVTDTRADLMTTEKIVDEASVDRYDFIKNAYQQHRQYEVYDGNPPEEKDDEFSIDDSDLLEDKGADGDKSSGAGSVPGPAPGPGSDKPPRHFLDLSAPE